MDTGAPPVSTGSRTSSTLIQRVKLHDEEAWRRLVWLYGPTVDRWARDAGLQPADAQDLLQEVFAAVASHIDGFRKDRPTDGFRKWLRTITQHKLVDHFRRLGRHPVAAGGSDAYQQLQEIEALPELSDASSQRDARRQFRLRVLELIRGDFPERIWQMFWRVTVDGHQTKEVAREFGVSPNAVRLNKSRVLRRLREELGELEPSSDSSTD